MTIDRDCACEDSPAYLCTFHRFLKHAHEGSFQPIMPNQCGRIDVIDSVKLGPCVIPTHPDIERHRDEAGMTWPDQDRIQILRAMGQNVDNSVRQVVDPFQIPPTPEAPDSE